MSLFPHREARYYSFALRAGVANLLSNGFLLGAKKTIGKITQPINAYSRFPEYYWFDSAVRRRLLTVPTGTRLKVLDVGSPKMLGLYLGVNTTAELILTDISELNVDEYQVMWRGLEGKAKGKIMFSLADARSLQFRDAEFDVVYSMSVVEHIEGEDGDSRRDQHGIAHGRGVSLPARFQRSGQIWLPGAGHGCGCRDGRADKHGRFSAQ